MSLSKISRQRFVRVVHEAAQYAGLNEETTKRLDDVARFTPYCAVGTFGSKFDPLTCQCPATQAGLLPTALHIEMFGREFDTRVIVGLPAHTTALQIEDRS